MSQGDDDFVYFGSALERVEDLSKRKQRLAVAEGRAKQVAVWKQEVLLATEASYDGIRMIAKTHNVEIYSSDSCPCVQGIGFIDVPYLLGN